MLLNILNRLFCFLMWFGDILVSDELKNGLQRILYRVGFFGMGSICSLRYQEKKMIPFSFSGNQISLKVLTGGTWMNIFVYD